MKLQILAVWQVKKKKIQEGAHNFPFLHLSSVRSVAQSCLTLCDPTNCSTPDFPLHHQLLELAQTHVHRISDVIQTISSSVIPFSSCLQSCPASGSFLMSQFFTSSGQVLELQLYISLSNEYSRLISFRIDWFDLLSVQGTLKSLLQHHSSKVSILHCSASFIVQHDYWKNQSFV